MTALQLADDHQKSQPVITVEEVRQHLAGGLYQGYAYSYPHKSAYRRFDRQLPLGDVWQAEPDVARGLYVHIPFCEMRCGFCNLFTTVNTSDETVDGYLTALEVQSQVVADTIGRASTRSLTIGGGTPTFLSAQQLDRLFDILTAFAGEDVANVHSIIETSPKTATDDRLGVLKAHGIDRVSIGVQSFSDDELRALGRPDQAREAERALDAIRRHGFACLNIDLIYGARNQTPESWAGSIERALQWQPEEMFLYPLYIRALTGLDGRAEVEDRHRQRLYQTGRDLLLQAGYEQRSMRMFAKTGSASPAGQLRVPGSASGEADAADHNLVGLGCGARSRTRALHYSSEYAVGSKSVAGIIKAYCETVPAHFGQVHYGVSLDETERLHRRFVCNLLTSDGLDVPAIERQHGPVPVRLQLIVSHLETLGMLRRQDRRVVPTANGLMQADAIGQLFYSAHTVERMAGFNLR